MTFGCVVVEINSQKTNDVLKSVSVQGAGWVSSFSKLSGLDSGNLDSNSSLICITWCKKMSVTVNLSVKWDFNCSFFFPYLCLGYPLTFSFPGQRISLPVWARTFYNGNTISAGAFRYVCNRSNNKCYPEERSKALGMFFLKALCAAKTFFHFCNETKNGTAVNPKCALLPVT